MGYVQELRSLVGHRSLILPGAAVLILNSLGDLLLQHRRDNQQWGLIGGAMEVGGSLEDTVRREAFEETGLELAELEWFDLFSGPDLIYECPNQDIVVNVVAVYVARQFSGTLWPDQEEAYAIRFFQVSELPELSPPDRPVVEQYIRRLKSCDSAASPI